MHRIRLLTAVSLLVSLVMPVSLALSAAAVTPHYNVLTSAKIAGSPINCIDVAWAAANGLLDPVEVHWLADFGIPCPDATVSADAIPSRQFVVMMALASRGQLSCADVEWNAADGALTWTAMINLAGLAGGCKPSQYATMASLLRSGRLSCADVMWNERNRLIDATQAASLLSRLACPAPATPDPGPTPQQGVTSGAFCSPSGAIGYTTAGLRMRCTTSATDSRNRWRQA